MSEELKDILGNSNKDIDNQKLMDYLSRQLSRPESHELEKMMSEDPFMNDAVEGLEQFRVKKDMPGYIEQLNQQLRLHLKNKKRKRERSKIKEQGWVYFTIILLLVLIALSYVFIKKYLDHQSLQKKPATTLAIKELVIKQEGNRSIF